MSSPSLFLVLSNTPFLSSLPFISQPFSLNFSILTLMEVEEMFQFSCFVLLPPILYNYKKGTLPFLHSYFSIFTILSFIPSISTSVIIPSFANISFFLCQTIVNVCFFPFNLLFSITSLCSYIHLNYYQFTFSYP